jgi:hypothetical protein
MSYQLIQHDEPLLVENIVVVLFGDPGTGKSSLVFTAENPLTFDFDRGLQRAVNRKASVRFETWADALAFMETDTIEKEGIKTLGIDTGGTMLDDYVARHILGMGVKGVDNGAGGLGLRGYGVMKDVSAKFFVKCKEKKVDIIFVCHSKKEDDGDMKKFFPAMTGGSYDIIMSKADLVGFMEMKQDKVTLDFNPTERHTGKNCAMFSKMEIPHFSTPEYATYMGKIISKTKEHMRRHNEAQVIAVAAVDQIKEQIENTSSIEELEPINKLIEALSPAYKAQAAHLFNKHYAELWALENIDVSAEKTLYWFSQISAKISELPSSVRAELQEPFKKLMDSANVFFDKTSSSFKVKSEVKPEAKQTATKPEKILAEKPVDKPADKPVAKKAKAEKAPETKPAESNVKPEAKEENPIVREDAWFLDRIGKKIIAKSAKTGTTEVTIDNQNTAFHMCAVMQKYHKVEYYDLQESGQAALSAVSQEAEA